MDQFPDAGQVMIVMLGDETKMVHEPHRLLQTRMQQGAGKQARFDSLYSGNQLESRISELR